MGQVFLFLFGILWPVFTGYAIILLVHHFVLTQAVVNSPSFIDYMNPAMVVRVELIVVGLCRFLYFVLLPFDIFATNVLGAYFLFEFPFILDFSIYSTFIQLFITVFHWRRLRQVEKRSLWIPLLIVNVLLFAFFFAVLIAFGVSEDPAVRGSLVLAYKCTLAALAFIVVIAFGVYGTVLAVRVRKAVKSGNAPLWLPQMKRLTVVTALATCGIMAIFIVIVYAATLTVPDPVLSSTPWVICFLFFAEMLPLFGILHDLHRTALVNQAAVLSRNDGEQPKASEMGGTAVSTPADTASTTSRNRGGSTTLSFAVRTPPPMRKAPIAPGRSMRANPRISGEVVDVPDVDSLWDMEENFSKSRVEL